MNETQHHLEYEKRLIELLGYHLLGPNGSNRWLIVDKNENIVGFIQYKKLHGANSKTGNLKIFGYLTMINSSNIIYKFTRELNDRNGNILDVGYGYSFDVKRANGDTDHVEIDLGELPALHVWSEQYGYIIFKIDYRGLYLNFKSKTENFNLEEVLSYQNVYDEYNNKKEYLYQLSYCKKDLQLSDSNSNGRTTVEISGIQYDGYDENQLTVSEKTWINGKLRTNRKSEVEGTVEEMAIKHQMGIECFNHFRFLINQIIPFEKEVFSAIVSNDVIEQNQLSIFFPDYDNVKNQEELKSRTRKNLQ